MNAPIQHPPETAEASALRDCLAAQRRAYLAAPIPDYASRIRDLDALRRWIEDERSAILAAINADFGNRSEVETLFAEVLLVLGAIKNAKSQLRRWMRPRRRRVDWLSFPFARNRVQPQPLGVVGVIAPWNFPLNLTLMPLVSIFAAGNRAMVKPSEFSQRFAELMAATSSRYFPPEKLTFFVDRGDLGPAFSALPFDHLVFTGSGKVGRAVMASAAANLTPLTLELGGKSPAIVAPDFPIRAAAERILWAKLFNAGQVCVNVDYALLPKGREEEFAAEARALVAKRYPDLNGADYTSIINAPSFARLEGYLADARAKGARLIDLGEGQTPDRAKRKFPPHLILGATPDMAVMREEIFGPILPVLTYDAPEQALAYVNAHDRPLGLYVFTREPGFRDLFLNGAMSGGAAVNDAMLQFAQADLPLGGVGASGLGQYQAREGFETFSKLRPIFEQGWATPVQWLFQPPYGALPRRLLDLLIRLKR